MDAENKNIESKINHLKIILLSILNDNYDKVLESNGKELYNQSHILSVKIHEEFMPSFMRFINQFHEEIEGISIIEQIESILLETVNIEHSLRMHKMVINKIKDKILQADISLLTESELQEISSLLLNDETKPSQFYSLDEFDKLYIDIVSTYSTNAAINSNLFFDGAEVDIAELEKFDPRLAFHAKKTALDQVCLSLFKDHSANYDELFYLHTLNVKSGLNELVKNPLKKDEIAFILVNMNDMDGLIFPKFIELMDYKTGSTCYVKEMKQERIKQKVACTVANNKIFVNTDVSLAVILTDIQEYQ